MKRISADSLLELALVTLRTELMPALPSDKRYAAAMVANALEIARREFAVDGESPLWSLLDEIYDDGEGSPAVLARDIRTGTASDETTPDLARRLLAIVESELAVRNPRFLQRSAKA